MQSLSIEKIAVGYFKECPTISEIWVTENGKIFLNGDKAKKYSIRYNLSEPINFKNSKPKK